jgi:hypothetical protein
MSVIGILVFIPKGLPLHPGRTALHAVTVNVHVNVDIDVNLNVNVGR